MLLETFATFGWDQHLHPVTFVTAGLLGDRVPRMLAHLHEHDIVYRDLKPENVLLERRGHVRVTDFGLSKRGGGAGLRSFVGSPEYLAPEVLLAFFDREHLSAGYGKAADWWAFGTLLFEMLTGRPPSTTRITN